MQQDLAVFAGQGLDIVTDDILGRVIQNVTLGVIERREIIVGVPVREVVLARVTDVGHDKGNTDPAVIRSLPGCKPGDGNGGFLRRWWSTAAP